MSVNTSPANDRNDPANNAADLIRQKLSAIYSDEPNAREELEESQAITSHRSKHQQFMYELGKSGKSLAQIQTEWHDYYLNLPDNEKHQVWQEFYREYNHRTQQSHGSQQQPATHAYTTVLPHVKPHPAAQTNRRSVAEVRSQLVKQVGKRSRAKRGGHLKSLGFGLSAGAFTVLILLFGFFNERFIAPFISPSKNVSDSSIIIDPTSTTAGPEPKIIIPKINVEIPVIYDQDSIAEEDMQSALEQGVVHYATTSNPGETGNGAIFGHSSNNILNKGKYKFAFVLLNRLEAGDTFILQKDSKRYVYRVFNKKVVNPNQISVLHDTGGKTSTFSLITCDPPGTTLHRLVVMGEQITPDPANNVASTAKATTQQPAILPGNSESLWHRFWNWLSS